MKTTKTNFENGKIVWDTNNRCYGVILNNLDNKESQLRLDSDGMQPVDNLRKLGSKKDKGTKAQLIEAPKAHKRLITNWPGRYKHVNY